jgi:hypothetical protein
MKQVYQFAESHVLPELLLKVYYKRYKKDRLKTGLSCIKSYN